MKITIEPMRWWNNLIDHIRYISDGPIEAGFFLFAYLFLVVAGLILAFIFFFAAPWIGVTALMLAAMFYVAGYLITK